MRRHLVLGANGHVGSATASALLERGEAVTIVTHDASKADGWTNRGAEVAVLDIGDSDALRDAFRRVDRAFLLNPPAAPTGDTDAEEHRTARSIVAALSGSGLEQIVAESTYGAQPGEQLGDLSVLFDFEQALQAQPIPSAILRAAYYMSNWDASRQPVRQTRRLTTPFPPTVRLPMVAPQDIGRVAARLLCASRAEGIHHVEGPQRYTTADVATAFSDALGQRVDLDVVPRERWEAMFRGLGFSAAAARAYARMTALSVDGIPEPADYERGVVTLSDYISQSCAAGHG
jgi:uncharacterized protein YbjT (DUF2867 family)